MAVTEIKSNLSDDVCILFKVIEEEDGSVSTCMSIQRVLDESGEENIRRRERRVCALLGEKIKQLIMDKAGVWLRLSNLSSVTECL